MKIKHILIVALCLVLVSALSIIGTVAYLTDSDVDVNVMTFGNVKIKQHEYQRVVNADGSYATAAIDNKTSYVLENFVQGKPLYPATELDANGNPYNYGAGNWDSIMVRMSQVGSQGGVQVFESRNAQDKFVTIENTGKTDAYVRTLYAFEIGSKTVDEFNALIHISDFMSEQGVWSISLVGVVAIDGNNYCVFEYLYNGGAHLGGVHENGVLPAGETTYAGLCQIYMTADATNEDCAALDGNGNGTYDVLVLSQAVQAAGFNNASVALNVAFGSATVTNAKAWFEGGEAKVPSAVANVDDLKAALTNGNDAVLTENISSNTIATGYGQADIKVNGGTLDGNGNTLSVNGSGDYSAISTTGGTIQNLAIDNGFRGIFLEYITEDVYLDKVNLGGEGVCYCINTGSNTGEYSLYVTNSVLNGWTSFSMLKSASFTNCSFGQGEYYTDVYGRLLKPYVNTSIKDSSFIEHFYLDLSALEAGCKITLTNCTVNGVALTASVVSTSGDEDAATFFIELPDDGRTLADCVIFN